MDALPTDKVNDCIWNCTFSFQIVLTNQISMDNSAGSSCTEITYFHTGSLKAQNSIYDHKKLGDDGIAKEYWGVKNPRSKGGNFTNI